MKFNEFARAISRIFRIAGLGFFGHGTFYRSYLLLLGTLFAATIMWLRWGEGSTWAILCDGNVGWLGIFCKVSHAIFPASVGVMWGSSLILLSSLLVGISKFCKLAKFENAFQAVGLKNALGRYPNPIDIKDKKDKSKWLTVKSDGIGIDKFKDRIRDLETAIGMSIHSIEAGTTPSILRLSLFSSVLPRICEYDKLKDAFKSPYSFLVGKSALNTVEQSILSLPHLLVAGTTGGGKSVFFKQALLGLLDSSPRIQMYLFDLKGGVEMNVFSQLPNVQVYKDAVQAVKALETLNKEMDERLAYLVQCRHTKVDFERDKLDMIVVGVDEASELYGKSTNKAEQKIVEKARELTDRLTKLARATGIHVILATQKVLKETIDTKVQENIGGRMVFRVNTLQNSLTVLGNKMAHELPDIPGRAIWSSGNKFTEVQAPLLSDEYLKKSLARITEDFEENIRQNFGQMLCPVMKEAEVPQGSISNG